MIADLFHQLQDGCHFPDDACRKLYERAKNEQWRVDHDIDWSRLQIEDLGAQIRQAMAVVYGQLLFGEVIALHAISRAVDTGLPALWIKLFGATQIMDEARHVEFFSRVTAKLGGPPSALPAIAGVA